MSDRRVIAKEAWGDVPDWIEVLIVECDNTSQSKAAARIGRSASVISQTIRNAYPGNMKDIEDRVRAVLCPEQVKCPSLGWIGSGDCLAWRDRAQRGLHSSSPMTVRMFKACRACDRYRERNN